MFRLSMSQKVIQRLLVVILAGAAAVFFGTRAMRKSAAATEEAVVSKEQAGGAERPVVVPAAAATTAPGNLDIYRPDPGLTPEVAKARLEEFFAKSSNLSERMKLAVTLMMQLCENGYSAEAFGLLDANYGTVRENEIRTLFQYADLSSSELLRRIDEVSEFQGDKRRAVQGYLRRFKVGELAARVSDPEFQAMLAKGRKVSSYALSSNLAGALEWAPAKGGTKTEYLDGAKELVAKGYLRPVDFLGVVPESLSQDVFERWSLIQGVIPPGTLISGDDEDEMQRGQLLVAKMVMEDGPRTMDSLLKVEDYRSVEHAIAQWTHSDAGGAAKWYEGSAGKLSAAQNNAVTTAFASTALDSAEFDVARAWAGKVQDVKAREELLGRIAEREGEVRK